MNEPTLHYYVVVGWCSYKHTLHIPCQPTSHTEASMARVLFFPPTLEDASSPPSLASFAVSLDSTLLP